MAYNNENFTNVVTTLDKNLHFYTSDVDTTAEIVASGYFDPTVDTKTSKASILVKGSVIIISDGATTQNVCVTSEQGVTPVTVA